ncbi:MAG: DNA mismatch repair endonuclease MutL [Myxococcales bacterium]|jgi:DNA mismatch repair protein MutL|nr:DNA mismatch repair endonuclease MutL [Myxococcales bacterium]
MPLVQRLSETLIDQIAAGEVVERPASVAKELCENAIDAGARAITIDILEGGMRRIVITDDGCGMSPDDARACLERHATSKLRQEPDLKQIGTLGFRGEAIPAIASVSRFYLTTCPNPEAARVQAAWESERAVSPPSAKPNQLGTRLLVEAGKLVSFDEVGAPPGTRIEVSDLFFNTPARRKFLKRPSTEATHLIETVTRLALARPEIAFRLTSNGREVFSSPAIKRDIRERVALALGADAYPHLVPVELTRGNIQVRGHITSPDHTLSTSRGIYTFVNGRFIRDRSLVAVIQRAYADVTMPGRNPAAVLFIDLPLDEVDINVHPQKLEVRFADAQAVTGCVYRAVQEALRTSPWLDAESSKMPSSQLPPSPSLGEERPTYEAIWGRAHSSSSEPLPRHSYASIPLSFRPRPGVVLSPISAPSQSVVGDEPASAEPSDATTGFFSSLRIIGQFAATYVVCEAPGPRLVVIDQHAAHERVRFHALREAFRAKKPKLQPFLIPMTLELPPAEANILADNADALREAGFEIEPFGGSAIALKAVPVELVGCDHKAMLIDLAGELFQVGKGRAFDEAMEHALATMACHSAVRAHQALDLKELRALLDALDAVDFNTRCPHGRPVAAQMTIPELEKEVARR